MDVLFAALAAVLAGATSLLIRLCAGLGQARRGRR